MRTIQTASYWQGKVIRRLVVPEGFAVCAQTGKMFPESDLLRGFVDWVFPRQFLRENGIYAEDADWLSDEGQDEIFDILYRLGVYEAYVEAACSGKRIEIEVV